MVSRDEVLFKIAYLSSVKFAIKEKEVIEKIENCKEGNIAECFKIWKNATEIKESDILPGGIYSVGIENVKIRYINPLVKVSEGEYVRVSEISEVAKNSIEKALQFRTKKYAYLDFNFS